MYAVEFQARIRDGIIKIPDEYRERLPARTRVILLAEEEHPVANVQADLIGRLLAHPVKIKGFKPLSREETHR